MNKEQFLRELERLLQDVSVQEREEAMQYYRDYFDDAGPENEARVISELGSPESVARTIKEELGPEIPEIKDETVHHTDGKDPEEEKRKKANGWKIAFWVLLTVLLLPIIIPVGITLIAVGIGVIATVVAIAFAIGGTALGLLVAGLALVVVGVGKILLMPATGIALAGAGLLFLAFGILAAVLIVFCLVKVIPWLVRGIVWILRYPFRKRREDKR